jgi:hypothetical protein
MFNKT